MINSKDVLLKDKPFILTCIFIIASKFLTFWQRYNRSGM